MVYSASDGWYEIGLGDDGHQTGWIAPASAGLFRSVESLLVPVAYATPLWNRELHAAPSRTSTTRVVPVRSRESSGPTIWPLLPGPEPSDFEILETRRDGEQLWLRVDILQGRCRAEATVVVASGWLPVYEDAGMDAWFYSRGC